MRKLILFVSFVVLSLSVIAQVPTITSYSPASAEVGASVTITGTNFDATPANNIVYFGSVKGVVTAATTTSLTVTVPKSSIYGKISVLVNGLQDQSSVPFHVINNSIAANSINSGANWGTTNTYASGSYSNGEQDMSILAADFDGNGMVDVVKIGSGSLNVHRNLLTAGSLINSSSFSAAISLTTTGTSNSIVSGDINGDGKIDLISSSGSGIDIFINTSTTGAISFNSKFTIASSPSNQVRVGDIDGDGLLDVIGFSGTNLKVYRNTYSSNTLSFSAAVSINSTNAITGIDVGDLNLDGKLDVVASTSTTVQIFLNNSTSGSISLTYTNSDLASGGGTNVILADFDNDGDNDIYTTNWKLYKNDNPSAANNASSFTYIALTLYEYSMGISVADFNGNGRLNIIGGTTWDKSWINICKSLPLTSSSYGTDAIFRPESSYSAAKGPSMGVDINGDDKVDYLSSAGSNSFFSISQNLMPVTPSITVDGTLSPISICLGTTSATQTLTVSGADLTANITATAPAGYEISLASGSGFASSITLTRSGTAVAATTIYVRLQGSASNNASGNIAFTSTGATTRNVATGTATVNGANNLGGSLSFNGNNQYLTVPNSSNFSPGTGDFTVEWFQYQQSTSNWPRPFSIGSTQLAVSIEGGSLYLWLGGTWIANAALTNYLNTWAHFAIVKSSSNIKVYKDGVAIINIANTSNIAFTGAFNIGAKDGSNAGESFNGYITNFRFSNAAIYTSNFTVSTSPLASSASTKLLLLASNSGSILTDSGPSALTLTNTASTVFNSATPFTSPISGNTVCIGSPLQLTHPTSGGTWSIPATTGLSISNTGVLTGSASTTASSVVVSYDYTINTCSFTDTKTITVSSLTSGTATGNQTLCSSSTTVTAITLAGNTSGSSIQWQSSLDNVTFNNIANATSASLSPGSVTATTYYRAAVTTAACGTLNSNVISKGYNNSLNFDGTDDHVTLPNVTNGLTSFTFESWVFPTATSDWQRIFDFGTGRTVHMFLTTSEANLRMPRFAITNNGMWGEQMVTSNTALTQNKWNHVAVSLDAIAQEGKIYLNGVLSGTATITINPSTLGALTNHYIGRSHYVADPYFKGSLDNVTIWNTVRTNDEIKTDMTTTVTGTETGLVANYDFNQGIPAGANAAINSVIETKNAANNGTLVNFTKTAATSNFIDGFRVLLTDQPVAPSAVCLNASSNTISVTAVGSGITYQWYSNTANSTTGATAITNATTNSYTIPTNAAGTKYYYVVVTGSCASRVTSNIVSQVVNSSTFGTEPSSAAQNIAYGGTATALTVASAGATAYQWYSTPTMPSLVSGFSGGAGWTSSTGSFQTFALYSGGNPAIDSDGYLRFAYISPSSIHRDFNLDQAATTISFSAQYASLDNNNDRGKIQLYFYNASNTQVGSVVQSADLTGSNTWQSTALSNVAIPSGATKVRVVFYQIQEYPYWAGNYGIAFRNPSVTTNVALNGTAITGATSATYTPSTTTPGALYYYAVATGGCSTATSALSGLITVGKATPTIASMAAINKTFGDASFTLTAPTSNATGAFTFTSSNPAVATISGTTVTIVGAGTATITATQATDANYNAGSVTALLTVAKGIPVIAFMADISKTFGNAPFSITAPASNSTGAFSYTSSTTSVATIAGSLVSITGAGSTTITVSQAASANYNAGSITALLFVAKANPTITILPNITRGYGSAAVTLVAPSSNSNGAFTYTISDAAVATISGATLTAVGIGTATLTTTQAESANYNAGSVTRTVTVVKGNPTIGTFAAINKTFGDAAFALTAPSSLSTGAFTYASSDATVATVSGSTVTIVGAGTANITATQATDANYNPASVTAVLTVAKATPTLSSFADINKTTTDAPFTLTAPISSAGTGAITYSSSNTAVATVSGSTVTPVGIGTSTITATQAEDANYLAASITATLTVILGDSDGDGVPDDVEIREGTDPNNPSSVKDSDGDGVPDYVEIGNGTNPSSPSDAIDSDGDGLSDYYEARNAAPTNITISSAAVNENNVAGAGIIDLTATDVNIGEVFTYTLVAGTGDTDNASFTINGSSLQAVASFDFETKTSYSFRLKVTDKGGLSFEKEFTITVTDVNEAPTALALTGTSVLENAASGTAVGTLAGTDADAGDTHTYTLVSGTGSTDNASFTITGTTISTASVFNFEAKNSYSVRVRVTDAGGLSFEKAFTITVTDVNEAPTLTAITDRRVYNVSTSQIVNLAGITAGPETAQTTTTSVSTSNPTVFTAINVVGTQIQFTLAAGIATPQDVVVTVRVKDNGGVANGGVDSVVRTFKLGIDPMPVAAASPNLITLGATAQLSATGANAVNYTWVAVGGTGIVGSGATINVRPRGTTTYAVVVTNSFGYQATVPVLLTVIVDYKLVPNNLVTPNGDGVNDKWVIPNIDMYPDNEVMVYDKAGRAVFTKRGYNNEWDGTLNGTKLKEDAYFYVIKFNKDGALPIRGYVSIVR
jgi:gliding motility-associated-like protein